MSLASLVDQIRTGDRAHFPSNANSLDFAKKIDAEDPLCHLRDEFTLPTRRSLKKNALDGTLPGGKKTEELASKVNGYETNGSTTQNDDDKQSSIYFCGNSLGVQPNAVRRYVNAQLETWASIGVHGHFEAPENSPLVCWQDMAEDCAKKSAHIVGALPHEVVVMNTLTVNLHLLMASFYRPDEKRHKVIVEWRPFPSDWYAIESQIQWHGLDPVKSIVSIQPDENLYISTDLILRTIDQHANDTALLLLPGIQYYTGQLFEIQRITKYAQDKGIVVGWDLAHAAGNVPLNLHDWNVDFAAWCTYKYMNAGPGAIAGAFIHERHGKVEKGEDGQLNFRHRLTGWYSGDKSVRFNMDNKFVPSPGASGFQLSNPSAIDLAALSGTLSIFAKTDMESLRAKALVLTGYAEYLLDELVKDLEGPGKPPLTIITPRNPEERGTQLSVLLADGLLDRVTTALTDAGVVCDKRKPDVIRIAPVPLYCTFEDVYEFMQILRKALTLGKQ